MIQKVQFTVIIGPNVSEKTTALKVCTSSLILPKYNALTGIINSWESLPLCSCVHIGIGQGFRSFALGSPQ
jgi:hypothetical protein